MISVKVSRPGQEAYVRRTNSREESVQNLADAVRDFKGTGYLITVHGRGEHRDVGDFIHTESA